VRCPSEGRGGALSGVEARAPYDTDRLLVTPGERYDVMLIVSGTAATSPSGRQAAGSSKSTWKEAPYELSKVRAGRELEVVECPERRLNTAF